MINKKNENKKSRSKLVIFATVGGSPLPVFIGLKFFADSHYKKFEQIDVYFIESRESNQFTTNIIETLNKETVNSNLNFNRIVVDEKKIILNKFKAKVEQVLNSLNYYTEIFFLFTSGTKNMVIDTLISLLNYKEVCLTNLSAELDKIIIKKIRNHQGILSLEESVSLPENKKLSDIIDIDLHIFSKLHNIEIVQINNNIAEDLLGKKELTEKLLSGYITITKDKVLQQIENEIRKKENVKQFFNLNETNSELLSSFFEIISDLNLKKLVDNLIENNRKKEILNLVEYLRGVWLEDFCFNLFLSTYNMKARLYKNVVFKHKGRKAEIDVVISEGFNLTVVSVTTSRSIGLIKLKLFEVLHRANQIGGMHSMIFLVTLLEKWQVEQLKRDISQFELKKRIKIIGKEEIVVTYNEKQTSKK
ncbi:MAG: hypothetical protein K9W46_04275 [Candidatus Heimdallarchaeum endolithica]|uniref:Uncharacterized protein n=1 Tax=Candidatus Heimdallarchaeum endolithica TaxID=2876572 RepID=A0A9Y1BSE0_9ARCH|nr:MAG: hypothetical protein K9W46_04275 [Candidatus Heimdallarchaeum endolithica]